MAYRGNIDTDVLLHNVAFPLDIGDHNEITQIGFLLDLPLHLAADDSINATCPHVRGVLPLAEPKAPMPDFTKLPRSQQRPV